MSRLTALLVALGLLAACAHGRRLRAEEPSNPFADSVATGEGDNGPASSNSLVMSAVDPATGYAVTTGFQASSGRAASAGVDSFAQETIGDLTNPIASGSQQAVGEGSNTLAIAANGAFATPVSAGTGGLAAVQATGTGAVAAYGSQFVTNDILDGFAFGTQSATAVGSNPRASIGSLALSQSTGTFSEGLTSSQTASAKSLADAFAGAGLPTTTGAYGQGSFALTNVVSAAIDQAATSFGDGFAQGNKALVVVNAEQSSETEVEGK